MKELENDISNTLPKEILENLNRKLYNTGNQKICNYVIEEYHNIDNLLIRFVGRIINDNVTIKFFSRKIIKTMLLVVLFVTFSCNPQPNGGRVEQTVDGDFTIKTIDSCEYIEYDYGIFEQRVYSLTHKGNCKYCITRNKK